MKFLFFILFFLLFFNELLAQPRNGEIMTIKASRVTSDIKIDGFLDEEDWINANIARDFSEYWPDNVPYEDPDFRTEVKVLYSNTGLYIGARMYDPHPDNILRQVTKRDQEGVADLFTIKLNPYNDAQQEFIFKVTAAGVQVDALTTMDKANDSSWDAIWMSAVSRDDKGWVAEIKIPYSALRFPKSEINNWSVNFLRLVRRNRKTFSWVFIDRNSNNQMLYTGLITGIENISPPVRLFLIPYASTYYNIKDSQSGFNYKAGADIKWGISSNFTLDAILIPDFGQTAFDNVEYVLGPFEQEFSEKRSFFTEGLELFNKGDLLYTRRIGQLIRKQPKLNSNESIIEVPHQAGLLNAIKISGRTSKGLGIGVSNALTDKAIVTIKDKESGSQRTATQTPLTNFNIIVLDQRYGDNNSLSFVNTNVLRNGDFPDANVSALISDVVLGDNKYNIKNELKYSIITDNENSDGIWLSTEVGEIKGKHRYSTEITYVTRHFDINDLGILFQNNYTELELDYNFRLLQSTSKLNSFSYSTSGTYRVNNESKLPEMAEIELRVHMQNRVNNYTGMTLRLYPFITYDHYEPRTPGRYMQSFRNMVLGLSISPNYNKRFLIETWPNITFYEEKGMWDYRINLWPRYRINDKIVVTASSELRKMHKNRGFAAKLEDDIIIGQRDRISAENTLSVNFNYNPKSSAFLMLRHYWLAVKYTDFYILTPDGGYKPAQNDDTNRDFSYNNWNIDIGWNYWFAPGSQLAVLYRHSANSFESQYNTSISDNLRYLFSLPQSHSISLRISYFLDYNNVRNVGSRKI